MGTVWTREQIQQARGLRAQAVVDQEMIDRRALLDVFAATRQRLARAIVEMAHPFAIEINPGDLHFEEVEEGFVVDVVACWRPTTKEVHFRGGARDGEILAIPNAGPFGTVRVPRLALSAMDASGGVDPAALATLADLYECVGWHETDRRWIYEVRR